MISVIIPTFNRKELTKRAIISVLEQSFVNYELIVVDDGSTDDYSDILTLLKNNSHHYYKINHSGVSAARNFGLSKAKYDWISFLDSDDEWHKDKLKEQVAYLNAKPETKVLQTYEKWVRNGDECVIPERLMPFSGYSFDKSLYMCGISPSSVILHKDVFDHLGDFDEKLLVCEDYEMWLRVTSFYKIHIIPKPLVIKYAGTHKQLSNSEIAMDRFRVYSLIKYISSTVYPYSKKLKAFDVLLAKLNILRKGATKRKLEDDSSLYNDLYKYMESNAENLNNINPGLIKDKLTNLIISKENI